MMPLMTDPDAPEPRLLFTEAEWNAAMPELTKQMVAHLQRYRTPVFKDFGEHGEGRGTGGFVDIGGAKYVSRTST